MTDQLDQSVTTLTESDQQRLQEQRAVIEQFVPNEHSLHSCRTTVAGKLGIIRAIIQQGIFKPNQKCELQSLGIVLGDAFVQELKMEWIMVEDDYGRDPALRLPGTSVIMYPLTMISKRIERGERVDVFELFNGVAARVQELSRLGA